MRMIPNKDSSKDLLSTIIIYGLLIASILEKLFCEKNPFAHKEWIFMHACLHCMENNHKLLAVRLCDIQLCIRD